MIPSNNCEILIDQNLHLQMQIGIANTKKYCDNDKLLRIVNSKIRKKSNNNNKLILAV